MEKIFLYIDVMYRCGAQRVMANLTEYFARQGYDVILCNDFIQDENIPHYTVNEKVKRVYLADVLGGNVIVKNVKRVLKLRRLVKEEKPDVVLSFLGHPNKRMLLATLGLKVKRVVSVRNDPTKEYGATGISRWFARSLFALADGCVFQTEDAASYFPQSIRERSKIIMNPLDEQFFSVCRADNPKNIITVGRLMPQKNHKLLIEAFSKIAEEFPDEDLIIYGDGPLRAELSQLCETLKIQKRVKLPGTIQNVADVLAQAKLFVLSSDHEGMPNALMEAMAAGVPCISTDCPCGGPRMLIQNEKQGILVKCGDVDMLAESMKTLLSNDNYRNTLGITAHNRMEECRSATVLAEWEHYLRDL